MKDFLKKEFYSDRPAEGAFAGTTLLLVLLWLAPSVILLFGGPMDLSVVKKESLIFFLPLPCLVLYVLTAWFHFYRKTAGNKKTVLFTGAFLLFSFFYLFFGGPLPGLVIPMLPVILAPVILIPQVWKFALARGLCLVGAAGILGWVCRLNQQARNFTLNYGLVNGPPQGWMYFELLLFSGTVLLLAGYLLSGLMYARTAQIPFRQMFGRGIKILWVCVAAVYLISLGMAFITRIRADRAVIDLEKHFSNPFSAQGLKNFYTNGRKVDAAFWDKLEKTAVSVEKEWEKFESRGLISSSPEGVYPPELLKKFEALMERSEPLRELEKMFDRPLPARDIKYQLGAFAGVLLPELNLMRGFCRWELWRIRFAAGKNDLPGALNALKRMKTASDYLVDKPSCLIAVLVMIACENYRMLALEVLLSSGIVTEPVLKQWQNELEQADRKIPQINFDSLYTEAAMVHDLYRLIVRGGWLYGLWPAPFYYRLRWFFPSLWYRCAQNRSDMMRRLKVRGFGSMPKMKRTDVLLGGMSGNDLPVNIQHKFDQLSVRYRAARALIGVELEKRKTGKYPDKLENPPVDPFTGKPMLYRKGAIPVSEPVWNVKKKFFDANTVRSAEGIAIWSLGANGKDDHGQNAYGGGPKDSDDIRAKMIFKKGDRD